MAPNQGNRKIHKDKNTRLEQVIQGFLEGRHDGKSPLLAAVSGGSDSLALLYALAPYQSFIQVVHIDHQWREESGEEARQLEELAQSLDVPCHIIRVDKCLSEDGARNQRLTVYKRLLTKTGAQAVLLAHHRGDLAETTFKRIVEGAPLSKLAGIKPVSVVEGVTLWRPFLHLDKGDLKADPISQDGTNSDPTFHRALLRTQVFPYLEKRLKRPLLPNLARLSSQALLLADYLDAESAPYLKHLKRGPLGYFFPFTELPHPFLLTHIVRSFCEMGEVTLSRESVEAVVHLLQSDAANRQKEGVFIDRGRLFIFHPPSPLPREPLPLSLGTHRYGPWQVEVQEGGSGPTNGWEALWEGEASVHLPQGAYHLAPYEPRFSKRLGGVPAFLRPYLPVVMDGQKIHSWGGGKGAITAKMRVSLSLVNSIPLSTDSYEVYGVIN